MPPILRMLLVLALLCAAGVWIGPLDARAIQVSILLFGWAYMFPKHVVWLLSALRNAARRAAHLRWQGVYYAYQGQHIRFYVVDDAVWAAAEDILLIVRPQPDARELRLLGEGYATIPGQAIMGLSEAALLRMMALRTGHRRTEPAMLKFLRWLEREALPNLRRHPDSSA